jgi:hypothetical protein
MNILWDWIYKFRLYHRPFWTLKISLLQLFLLFWAGLSLYLCTILLDAKRRVVFSNTSCVKGTLSFMAECAAACPHLVTAVQFHLLRPLGGKCLITAGDCRHVSVQLTDGRDI